MVQASADRSLPLLQLVTDAASVSPGNWAVRDTCDAGLQEKDAEAGEGGGETETAEDKTKEDKGADVEDGLETVKLEPQEATEVSTT